MPRSSSSVSGAALGAALLLLLLAVGLPLSAAQTCPSPCAETDLYSCPSSYDCSCVGAAALESDCSLQSGVIAGIVIAIVVPFLLSIVGCAWCCRCCCFSYRRQQQQQQQSVVINNKSDLPMASPQQPYGYGGYPGPAAGFRGVTPVQPATAFPDQPGSAQAYPQQPQQAQYYQPYPPQQQQFGTGYYPQQQQQLQQATAAPV